MANRERRPQTTRNKENSTAQKKLAKQEKQKGGYLGLFGGSASLLEPSGPSNRPETRKVETVAIGERQRPVRGDQPSRDPQLTEQLQHKCIERLRFALKDGMTTCAQH